jgi:hypothetical protein
MGFVPTGKINCLCTLLKTAFVRGEFFVANQSHLSGDFCRMFDDVDEARQRRKFRNDLEHNFEKKQISAFVGNRTIKIVLCVLSMWTDTFWNFADLIKIFVAEV